MEKEKKVVKAPAKTVKKAETVKKSSPAKSVKAPVKQEKVSVKKVEEKVVPTAEVKPVAQTKKTTLNQELNLVIGLLSLMTIIVFCFAFQDGDAKTLGWELVLNAGNYSNVFKYLMVTYVVSIVVDCVLAIRIDTENEVLNIIEKALYMFTLIINFIVVAVLLSLLSNIGIGFIIFFIISAISVIIKFARIYSQK